MGSKREDGSQQHNMILKIKISWQLANEFLFSFLLQLENCLSFAWFALNERAVQEEGANFFDKRRDIISIRGSVKGFGTHDIGAYERKQAEKALNAVES